MQRLIQSTVALATTVTGTIGGPSHRADGMYYIQRGGGTGKCSFSSWARYQEADVRGWPLLCRL